MQYDPINVHVMDHITHNYKCAYEKVAEQSEQLNNVFNISPNISLNTLLPLWKTAPLWKTDVCKKIKKIKTPVN